MRFLTLYGLLMLILVGFLLGCAGAEQNCSPPTARYCQQGCERQANRKLSGVPGLREPADEEAVKRHFMFCLDECARKAEARAR